MSFDLLPASQAHPPRPKTPVQPKFKFIYLQKKILEDLHWSANARKILERFPGAEIRDVEQHWRLLISSRHQCRTAA